MILTAKGIVVIAGINGLLAVLLGAFAAHGLKQHISHDMLLIFNTGVKYQSMHACVLLFLGLMAMQSNDALWRVSAVLMTLGVILFSGSLYGLSLGGPSWLGPVTPIGGLGLIAAWGSIIYAAARSLPTN